MKFRYYRWNVRCGKVIEESDACPACGHHLSLHDDDGCNLPTCTCKHQPDRMTAAALHNRREAVITAELDTYVAELVAMAPPLTVQQMAKLRPILSSSPPPSPGRTASTLVMAVPSGGAGRGTGRR